MKAASLSSRPKPTDAELRILRALWKRGPASVREVMSDLSSEQTVGYTTVLKFMQIMTEKGLLEREEKGRQHIYRPTSSKAQIQRQLISHLMDRAFEGSARSLVLQALSARPSSADELAEIRRMIRQMEVESVKEAE